MRRIATVSSDQWPLVNAQRTVDLDRIAEKEGRFFIWSDELNEAVRDNRETDELLSVKTVDFDIPHLELKSFEEDMRNMPEAPLTEAQLDKMYTDALKDEECEGCLVDTLESHTHRDGPWEDETEEIA